MTRMRFPYGWLLYVNPDIAQGPRRGLLFSGDVLDFEINAERGGASWPMFQPEPLRISMRFDMAPGAQLRQGPPDTGMWQALQSWPDEKAGRRWPPEMAALLELARRHPEEYEQLRETEAVLRSLGG